MSMSACRRRRQNAAANNVQLKFNCADVDFCVVKYTKFDAQTVDAYLDLSVQQVGYMSHSMIDSPFKPDILLGVQLVDRTGKQLYEQHFLYGVRAKPNISATHIDADPSLFFSDYDAVMRDPKAAVKGLRSGIDTLTQRIAYDLHKS